MFKRNSILVATSLVAATLWGCGSNSSSGGDQTGPDNTLANAKAVGMSNCLTCHDVNSILVQDYLVSRHGNHLLVAAPRIANDPSEILVNDPNPTSCSLKCHDPNDDGASIDLDAIQSALAANGNDTKADWSTTAPIIGCEACHGGGQFHNGIPAGIPYATPGPEQCGKCHGFTLAKAEAGTWGSSHLNDLAGDNVRRNIMDSHYDNPATSYSSSQLATSDPLYAANVVEGYAVRSSQQTGCVDCHYNGHAMDLTKNYQWASSGHAGEIKTLKVDAMSTPVANAAALLANVTAAGPSGADYAWGHYDWDKTASYGSCQVCHTTTGIANFLSGPATYDLTGKGNNFSHLAGWKADVPSTVENEAVSSGQNELLYCWGCHSDSKGSLRNPGAIPLDYTYDGAQVVLPNVGNSNVCVKCHGGRGNNDTILANVAAADASLTDSVNRSTRAAEHHAPTAGSLFAAQTHTAYEYAGQDYTAANPHTVVGGTGSGPCASCHMGGAGSQEHTFAATEHDPDDDTIITTINHLTVCESCHGAGGMTVGDLQAQKDGFIAAKKVLNDLLKNSPANYLGLNIATTSNNNYKTVPVDAYGAFMNNAYLGEEMCAYVHNNLYARRVLFDSIKFMKNGNLTGTLDLTGSAVAAEFLSPGYGDIAAIVRP